MYMLLELEGLYFVLITCPMAISRSEEQKTTEFSEVLVKVTFLE